MNKQVSLFLGFALIVVTGGWGTPEGNVAGEKKQAINFYGSLETWANPGTQLPLENISVDNLYKQIPLFLKPTASLPKPDTTAAALDCSKCCAQQKTTTTKKYKEFILEGDPRNTLLETKIDLAEISELMIPHPDEVWTYQKEKGYSKTEYIEIVVISKDTKKTKTSYLIEKRKRIYSDRINAAGPEEQEIPLEALKSLKIDGYKDRKLETTEKIQAQHNNKKPAVTPQPTTAQPLTTTTK